jgi:iron complex transport system substrate-binding protein
MTLRTTRSRPARALAPAVLTLALLLTACGADDATDDEAAEPDTSEDVADDAPDEDATEDPDATDDEAADGDFPVTIESEGGTWTLEEAPERIVSLSPTATEVLFAIGAGDQVEAVDEFSYYPEEAPVTDLSGFDPNIEAVTSYDPDLVVISNDANELVAGLTSLDIPVLVSSAPADIESGFDIMAELGLATGRVDETATLVSDLREEIDAALAEAPDEPVRVYHELDSTYFAASSYGFVGDVYEQMGAINIADEGDPDQSGFPQLTEEFIVEADPELIVITDQVDYTADDVADRSGWQDITAVEEDNIVTVDADIASRWGPRLPQFITTVAEALSAVPADAS